MNVLLQAFSGARAVRQVAEDDGDSSRGVVENLGVVFEVALLASMDAVVVASLQEFCSHTHELLAGSAYDVVTRVDVLHHEGEREVVVEEHFHLVVLQILVAQVTGIDDVQPEPVAVVVDGVCLGEFSFFDNVFHSLSYFQNNSLFLYF